MIDVAPELRRAGEMFDALGDVPAARTALLDAIDRQIRLGQRLFAISPLRRLAPVILLRALG
jgi:hypothetical protein